jgi:hypothetical protein
MIEFALQQPLAQTDFRVPMAFFMQIGRSQVSN